MGRFDATKATIDANIKSNGNQEITGDILNSVMKGMVDATDAQLAEQSAKLTELSADVGEVESVIDAVTIKGKPSANLFKPTIVGMMFSQYGSELKGDNLYCQVVKVTEGDVLRLYIWSANQYEPQKANVFTAYANDVAVGEKGLSDASEYLVPNGIDEVRVGIATGNDPSWLCLTRNEPAPSVKVDYAEGKIQIITDATLQKEGVPADAKAVGERLGARIDFANYQQNQGAINKLGIVDVNDSNYWYSAPIAVKRGEVVHMTTPYQGTGMAIGRTDADGNYYAPIAIHDNTKSYVANIDFDGYIAITFIKNYLPTEFYKETSQFAIDKGAAETYADLEVAKKESAEIDYKALEVQHETHFTNLCIQARFERGKMVAELATLTDDDILAQGSCGYTESNGQITDGTIKWRIYKGGLLHISGYGKMYDFIKGTEAAKSEEEVHQKVRDLGAEFWYYGFVNENVNGIVPPFPQSNQKYDTDEVMNYSNKRYVPFGEDINPLNGKPYGYSAPWYIYRVHVDDSYTSYDLYKEKNPNEITYNRILIEEDASKGGITYIGNWAFYRVSADTLILPASVTKIGCWGVRYSPVLKALVMGDNITTIEDHGVSRMEAMEAVKVSNKLVSLGYEGMSADAQLKMVEFPDTTTSLGSFCFNGCGSLQIANFGSCRTIPRNFATLSSLVKAYIPITTETIGANAFYKTDINRLIIPSNVSNIESDAFRFVDIKVVVIESQSILDKMTIQNAPDNTQLQQGACIRRCDYILIPIGLTPSYAIEQLFLYKGEDENYRYYKRNTPKVALDS